MYFQIPTKIREKNFQLKRKTGFSMWDIENFVITPAELDEYIFKIYSPGTS